jgi:hypothetical protein
MTVLVSNTTGLLLYAFSTVSAQSFLQPSGNVLTGLTLSNSKSNFSLSGAGIWLRFLGAIQSTSFGHCFLAREESGLYLLLPSGALALLSSCTELTFDAAMLLIFF